MEDYFSITKEKKYTSTKSTLKVQLGLQILLPTKRRVSEELVFRLEANIIMAENPAIVYHVRFSNNWNETYSVEQIFEKISLTRQLTYLICQKSQNKIYQKCYA